MITLRLESLSDEVTFSTEPRQQKRSYNKSRQMHIGDHVDCVR